jgi:hypothetical protein
VGDESAGRGDEVDERAAGSSSSPGKCGGDAAAVFADFNRSRDEDVHKTGTQVLV